MPHTGTVDLLMDPSDDRTGATAAHSTRTHASDRRLETLPRPRLRVLWLVKGLGPGGAERLLASAARVHDHDRFALDVAYVLPAKSHLVPDLEAAGVVVHCLGDAGDRPGAWIPRLRRLLAEGRYDIVHLHSPLVAGVARLLSLTARPGRRPRLVSTEHNAWDTFSWPTRLLNGLTWGLDHAHLAVSEEARASVRPRRRSRRVEYLLHGTDLETLDAARAHRARVRQELGVADDEVLVGTVANYRAQKAYPDLLAAARRVLDTSARARFVAVGQGPLEGEIHALHDRLGLGGRFALLGYRPDPEQVLAACDVFVLSSHFEGYPIALMEALAMGLPVVATAVGGVTDAIDDGVEGLLVPPARPEALAEALTTMVGDDALRQRCATAARTAGRRFDIANAVARTEEIYRSVVG